MAVKEEHKTISMDEQKKMSPQERRILQRYGDRRNPVKSKARSINELYEIRYKSKFR